MFIRSFLTVCISETDQNGCKNELYISEVSGGARVSGARGQISYLLSPQPQDIFCGVAPSDHFFSSFADSMNLKVLVLSQCTHIPPGYAYKPMSPPWLVATTKFFSTSGARGQWPPDPLALPLREVTKGFSILKLLRALVNVF
jgi:hypothetical protein